MRDHINYLPVWEIERRVLGGALPELNRPEPPLSAGGKEARDNLEKARLAFEAQQKEKAVPDIKSALEKALAQTANAWAADDEAHKQIQPQQENEMKPEKAYFSVTNNVCRTTFDFVRDNPGMTRVEIAKELEKKGFKSKSVSSLLGQMLRQGLVYANGKLLYANSNEYTPIKSSKVLRARAETPVQRKKVTIVNTRTGEVLNPKPAGIASLPAKHVTTALYTTPAEWSVESVIGGLNVRQAMAVYAELRNIFGA
jgi:hypothetical protein